LGYSLEALIGKDALVTVPQLYPAARVIRLHHGLQMIPLTEAFATELLASRTAEQARDWEEEMKTRGLSSELGKRGGIVAHLASPLSERDPVAFVQAEFFGGVGGQSALVWQRRQVIWTLDALGIGAINKTLQWLGVRASNPESWFDEFEMVGLGQRRDTEKWADVAVEQEVRGVSEWEAEQFLATLASAERALSIYDPKHPAYQTAKQMKKWAEQQLEELRRKTEGSINS